MERRSSAQRTRCENLQYKGARFADGRSKGPAFMRFMAISHQSNRARAEMAHVGVERFGSCHTEKNATQNEEAPKPFENRKCNP
jgi:hypothetical protein